MSLTSALDGNELQSCPKSVQVFCPFRAAVEQVTQQTRFLEGVKGAWPHWAVSS